MVRTTIANYESGERLPESYNGICDSTALSCRNGKLMEEDFTNREYKEN